MYLAHPHTAWLKDSLKKDIPLLLKRASFSKTFATLHPLYTLCLSSDKGPQCRASQKDAIESQNPKRLLWLDCLLTITCRTPAGGFPASGPFQKWCWPWLQHKQASKNWTQPEKIMNSAGHAESSSLKEPTKEPSAKLPSFEPRAKHELRIRSLPQSHGPGMSGEWKFCWWTAGHVVSIYMFQWDCFPRYVRNTHIILWRVSQLGSGQFSMKCPASRNLDTALAYLGTDLAGQVVIHPQTRLAYR